MAKKGSIAYAFGKASRGLSRNRKRLRSERSNSSDFTRTRDKFARQNSRDPSDYGRSLRNMR